MTNYFISTRDVNRIVLDDDIQPVPLAKKEYTNLNFLRTYKYY